ncbi:hypothetical protein BC829DRAFT_394801 [Chytridium lagenaria]|nr:hypothetical protein BC829DRAFT_394801 [Chytridium lagenaria]
MAMELEEDEYSSSDSDSDSDSAIPKPISTSIPATPLEGLEMIPIVRQALELLEAARQNPIHYQAPEVYYVFFNTSDAVEEQKRIIEALKLTGVQAMDVGEFRMELGKTRGEVGALSNDVIANPSHEVVSGIPQEVLPDWRTVWTSAANLDVTTLITLASDISNQFDKVPKGLYSNEALILQEEQECLEPILHSLVPALEGKELLITQTALKKYIDIARVIAGPREKARTLFMCSEGLRQQILSDLGSENWRDFGGEVFKQIAPLEGRMSVVADDPSERFVRLSDSKGSVEKGGKKGTNITISQIQANIFGTADRMEITTVTANGGLVRSLTKNGVLGLSLYLHEPRSFIETRTKMRVVS